MTSTGNENDYLYLVTVELVKVNLKYTSFCLEKVNNMSKSSQQTTLSDNILKTSTKSQTDISSRSYSAVMNRGRLPLSSSEPERSIRSCKRSEHYSLVDLFQYVFYFPLFFCAPVVTYNTFHTQVIIKGVLVYTTCIVASRTKGGDYFFQGHVLWKGGGGGGQWQLSL